MPVDAGAYDRLPSIVGTVSGFKAGRGTVTFSKGDKSRGFAMFAAADLVQETADRLEVGCDVRARLESSGDKSIARRVEVLSLDDLVEEAGVVVTLKKESDFGFIAAIRLSDDDTEVVKDGRKDSNRFFRLADVVEGDRSAICAGAFVVFRLLDRGHGDVVARHVRVSDPDDMEAVVVELAFAKLTVAAAASER